MDFFLYNTTRWSYGTLVVVVVVVINVLLFFRFLNTLQRVYTSDQDWEEVVILCILCICIFAVRFGCYFSTHIDLRKWEVPQCEFFLFFSFGLGLPVILLVCLFVHSLIILRADTLTGMVVVLRCQFFQVSFPGIWIYLLYSSTDIIYQLDGILFLF